MSSGYLARDPALRSDSNELDPDEDVPRDRLRLLLKEFSALGDAREPWRILYPLNEVLLLVTCNWALAPLPPTLVPPE